jgi:hypothetical protein
MPATTGEAAWFLIGCLVGAVGVLVLTALAWFLIDVRRAVVEGTPISGEELERNRKRGTL